MAGIIDRVTTADTYGKTAATGTLQNLWTGKGGNYTVGNAAVFYQLQYGSQGDDAWTTEAYSGPSQGVIPPGCTGVRFRSYTAGTPAIVFATIAEGKEPLLSGQQFAGTLSASGQPVAAGSVITGHVSSAGAIIAGSGYTITKGAAGRYAINFTTPFAIIPAVEVIAITVQAINGLVLSAGPAPTGSSVTVVLYDTGTGVNTDMEFTFTATAIV